MNFERRPWPAIYSLMVGAMILAACAAFIGGDNMLDLLQAIGWALTGGLAVPIPKS